MRVEKMKYEGKLTNNTKVDTKLTLWSPSLSPCQQVLSEMEVLRKSTKQAKHSLDRDVKQLKELLKKIGMCKDRILLLKVLLLHPG